MNNRRNYIKKDHELTIRMFFTGLMLALAYVFLFGLLLFSGINYLFVTIFGVAMVFFQYFMSDNVVEGWTSLIVLVLLLGGLILLSLGIIGEYVGRIYFEVKNRPNYIINEIIL